MRPADAPSLPWPCAGRQTFHTVRPAGLRRRPPAVVAFFLDRQRRSRQSTRTPRQAGGGAAGAGNGRWSKKRAHAGAASADGRRWWFPFRIARSSCCTLARPAITEAHVNGQSGGCTHGRGTRSGASAPCCVRWPVAGVGAPAWMQNLKGVHTFVLYCACARGRAREREGAQEEGSIGHHRWDWGGGAAGRGSGICRSAWTTAPASADPCRARTGEGGSSSPWAGLGHGAGGLATG